MVGTLPFWTGNDFHCDVQGVTNFTISFWIVAHRVPVENERVSFPTSTTSNVSGHASFERRRRSWLAVDVREVLADRELESQVVADLVAVDLYPSCSEMSKTIVDEFLEIGTFKFAIRIRSDVVELGGLDGARRRIRTTDTRIFNP